jgi:N-acetylglucosamine-6-phosphate deacetylase
MEFTKASDMGEPRYYDLQVNGYAGVDFNQDNVVPESLNLACRRLRKDGVAGILATIITDDVDVMQRRLRRIAVLRDQDELVRQTIIGVHIEGPFISSAKDYSGAHPRGSICTADVGIMQRLLEAAGGLTKIVTLAPEHDEGLAVTRMLSEGGIVVAAGHCNPTLKQLDAAIDAGLSMFTHLGNGCPMAMARHDNIVQRALYRSDRIWCSFIADGIHVDFHALSNYLQLAGDRALIVTDAMSAAGMGPGNYELGRWKIEVGEDLAVWAPHRTHLVGSAMTMAQAAHNLRSALGLSPQRIDFLLRTAAIELLGIEPALSAPNNTASHLAPVVGEF